MRYDYRQSKHPALVFVLRGLIPFTEENLSLSFKPSKFFYELSLTTGYSKSAIRNAYYNARQQGLIAAEAVPRLTDKGMAKVKPFIAQELGTHARLIVMFDIPEDRASVRQSLRRLLKNLNFEMVQQSVWMSDKDHREIILEAAKEMQLEDCLQIHESLRLFPE